MNYNTLASADPTIFHLLQGEEGRQLSGLELIASENYVSASVMDAMGSVLNNKYSEGYPGRRYYGGQEFTDQIEQIAIDRAKKLFKAGHANVQPHAGAPANIATYFALMEPGDKILGMDLSHGGHLTHGHPVTGISKVFQFIRYKMKDVETGEIDYDEMREVALRERPKVILAGFSSYPREYDYAQVKAIADEVGAVTVADMAHIAGLIAGGVAKNPFDYGFDVITTTTHKSLRGPRGGMILTREAELGKQIDKSVFPGFQGGPIMQMVAAKAVAFGEALKPEFKLYARQVVDNAKHMANVFMNHGAKLITNGTDNHLMVIDTVSSWGIPGGDVQKALECVNITLNMNVIPDDQRKPMNPSGVRIGTPALTTRGMGTEDMECIAKWVIQGVENRGNQAKLNCIREEVIQFARQYPVPGISMDET